MRRYYGFGRVCLSRAQVERKNPAEGGSGGLKQSIPWRAEIATWGDGPFSSSVDAIAL
jgi:hypothetical protein